CCQLFSSFLLQLASIVTSLLNTFHTVPAAVVLQVPFAPHNLYNFPYTPLFVHLLFPKFYSLTDPIHTDHDLQVRVRRNNTQAHLVNIVFPLHQDESLVRLLTTLHGNWKTSSRASILSALLH